MVAKKLNDNWFRLIGLPVLALVAHTVFYNRNASGEEKFDFWQIYLLSLAESMLLWEAIRVVIIYSRKRYPSLGQTRTRILHILVISTLVTLVIRTLNIFFYDKTMFWGYAFPVEAYLHGFFVALLFVIIVAGIYESIYYFTGWKHMAVRAEILKRENLQTQLNSLKAQVNPHFLFNSLGSLSSLVEENPGKAQQFITEMSAVYRYLLQDMEKPLTSLHNELAFIHAYAGMLETRFGNALQLSFDVKEQALENLLPPHTLQLLVENAVKHNAVLPQDPLEVRIFTNADNWLTVQNKLHLKATRPAGSGTGLHNIAAKYKLLKQPDIRINRTQSHFEVSIPLINAKEYESTDR